MSVLLHLALVFARLGLVAFGGSTAILSEMEHVVVDQQGWLTQKEFVDGFALGALTPGPALLMVMFTGFRVAGFAGAFVAIIALILPSAILATLATAQWNALRRSGWVLSLQRGAGVVALGLTASGAFSISRLAVSDVITAAIAIAALAVLWWLKVNAALIIPAGGVVGALLYGLLGRGGG